MSNCAGCLMKMSPVWIFLKTEAESALITKKLQKTKPGSDSHVSKDIHGNLKETLLQTRAAESEWKLSSTCSGGELCS